MEKYPDHKTYELLYARYFQKGVGDILSHLGSVTGKSVIDLCAGGGRLTKTLLANGASKVVMIDREQDMIPLEFLQDGKVNVYIGTVSSQLVHFTNSATLHDLAVCQQGINYWFNRPSIMFLANTLKQNGVFVFNTFNKKPQAKPRVLEYELEGRNYVEVSWLVGETVHHLQVMNNCIHHHTSFKWISPEKFVAILAPHFDLEVKNIGATSIYKCTKR